MIAVVVVVVVEENEEERMRKRMVNVDGGVAVMVQAHLFSRR